MAAVPSSSCWAASPALRADAEIARGGVSSMSRSLQRWLHETPAAAAAAAAEQQQQQPAVTDLVHLTDVEGCAAAPGRLVRIRGMVQDINANGHFVVGRSGPKGLRLVRDMCGVDGEAPPADSAGGAGQDAPYEVVFVHVVPTPGEACVFVAASDDPFGPPLPPSSATPSSSSAAAAAAAAAASDAAQRRGTKRARDGEEVSQKPFCHAPPPPPPAAAATEEMEVDAAVAASPSPPAAAAQQQQQEQPAQPRLYSEVDPRRNVVGDGTAAAKLSFVVKVLVPAADESAADADSNAHLPSLNAEVEFYGVVQARAAEPAEEEAAAAVDPRAPAMPATAFAMTELPYTQYLKGGGGGAKASAREFVGLCWRNRRAAADTAVAATAAVPPSLAAPAVGRDELLAFLSDRGFCGDAVAAEVVLLHLLGVHTEIIPVPLGSVPCNISGFGSEAAAARAARALRKVLEKVVVYDVSVPSLNRPDWLPHMDYSVEALATGKLQVTDGTHVVLDETGLAEGKLTNVGVQNLQALKNVALTAQVPYEYSSSYELEMHLKAPLLILSSTASLLKPVLSVKLAAAAPQRSVSVEEDPADAPEFLAALRDYIVSMCW